MKKIIAYEILVILAIFALWTLQPLGLVPAWLAQYQQAIDCVLVAALAGGLYCLRAIYVNRSIKNCWDENWETWYYLRPIASAATGLVAYIFIKASILVLEAEQAEGAGLYGHLAFSFLAGYNVDRFLRMIEDIARSKFRVEATAPHREKSDQV